MTTNVAIGEHVNDFRVGRRVFDPAVFVTAAEDVCLEFHMDKIHQLSNQVCFSAPAKRRAGALCVGRLGVQNARAGIPNRVAQGIHNGGGSWPHTEIVGATSGIAPGVTPVSAIKLWLRSAIGERGKWSGGQREAFSVSQPERNVPPPSHRRKPAAHGGTFRMPARNERAICGVERA